MPCRHQSPQRAWGLAHCCQGVTEPAMAHACSSVFCPEEYVVFLKESSVIHQHLRAGLFTDVWEALGRLVVAGWRADPWKVRRCPAGARRGRAPRRKCVGRADLADGGPRAQGPRVGVVRAGGWRDRATLNKTDSSSLVRWLPRGQVTLLQLTVTTRPGMCPSPGAPGDLTSPAGGVTAVSPFETSASSSLSSSSCHGLRVRPSPMTAVWAVSTLGSCDFCFRGHASVNCRADVFSDLGFVA